MIAVIDTGYLIERQIAAQRISKGYVTESVANELKTLDSEKYLSFFSFIVEIRNPTNEYVTKVREYIRNKVHNLSDTDIDVVALTLEIKDETSDMWIGPENPDGVEVCCLTYDNGIKNILSDYDSYEDPTFHRKTSKIRCYSCCSLFTKNMDFCKKCGHSTLTRVTVKETEDGEEVFLKKKYNYKPKTFKDNRGIELRSADQREYVQYQRMLNSRNRRHQELLKKGFLS